VIHQSAAAGFARAADAYERGRPGFPAAAIGHLVEALRLAPGRRVLELGAGTGKLTRELAPTGAVLTAVEPVAQMRARLEAAVPGAEALEGTAEAIPRPDASADAVVVAQAFHWFDGPRALREIARVLVPGGRLGLIWNARDAHEPWIASLDAILDRHRGSAPRYASGSWRAAFTAAGAFTPLQEQAFPHTHLVDRAGVLDRIDSISFIAALPDAERRDVLTEVGNLVDSGPGGSGEPIAMRYRTDVYWCERR
jgi:ubiquinone/menaquinone biosynthesis C-methylase UbiE